MSKLFKNRKFILISIFSLLILIVSTISFIALFSNKNNDDPRFKYNSGYYNDTSDAITTANLNSEYIKMNTLYSRTGSSVTKLNVTITTSDIIAIESESDLHAFSVLANAYDAFLTYKYVLLANIDMGSRVGETTTLWNSYDFYPIGYNGKVFRGIFNGNGHIIKNLKLKAVSNENAGEFNNTHYYAFFCQNTGTVGNFGLIDPSISINAIPATSDTATGIYYVSNVVGKNTGTVNNIFVRDSLDDDSNKTSAGIELLANNFHISGLVAVNTNVFKDSYYASTTVISSNTNPAEFQEVLIQGTNEETGLYFYNSLIETYSDTSVKYGGFLDKTFNYTKRYGTYCSTLATLNTNVMTTSNADFKWYMGSSYAGIEDLPTFFNTVITPITRGFRTGQVTYETDNKYHVIIKDTNDFSYIFELMDQNSKFASNSFVYEIDSDINMDNVLSPKYKNGIAATFTTKGATSDTAASAYKTIVLKKFSYSTTVLGYEAYGVFPYLTGTVQYLNFVVADNTNSVTFTRNANATSGGNVVAYGAIAGYVEGGTIDSCNVYSNLRFDSGVGRYFFGGAVGILGGEGSVTNVVTSGTITETNTSHATYDDTSKNDVLPGVVLGGVIGYVESSLGSVNQLLNKATITSAGYTGHDVALGGVVGAGFFQNATELQNKGAITFNGQYNALYISGVIGRLLGVSNQISMMTNNGNITVTQLAKTTYIAGVMTADIKTSGAYGTSLFKQKSAFYFYASALSNGANITVSGAKASAGAFTNVINVLSANGFITKLSGIYNLNYKFDATNTAIKAQSIDMSIFNNFSPVLYTNSANTNNYIDLMTAYNLRDMEFTTGAAISGTNLTLTYTGCALGNNINYADVRNEGNMTFTISKAVTANIKALGVFDELSAGFTAASIYNGGAIDINFTATITGNVHAAGICYANRNGIENINKYNPSSIDYDSSLIGSLNDVINNGNIKVTSTSFSYITFNHYWYRNTDDPNINGSIVAHIVETVYNSTYPKIIGNINTAGITTINESVITNAFNLGDIKALNYITETTEENKRQINAGGISTLNIGKYAYIINSANNGDITAANLSSYSYTTGTAEANATLNTTDPVNYNIKSKTTYYSDVNVGGIVSRNDKFENGNPYTNTATNPNSSQVISFTINYGSIYAYNYAENNYAATIATMCKAAGIIGSGLCNVINVNNYGTVYSGDVSAGIFGLVSLANYKTEIATNTVYIANTLNYGNVYSLAHSYDEFNLITLVPLIAALPNTSSEDNKYPNYSNFANDTLSSYKFVAKNVNTKFKYFSGSVIGVIDFNDDTKAATNIIIRYLVSFNESLSISGAEIRVNSAVQANTTTIFSPYLKPDADGYKDRDDYLATNVQYAPLSSGYLKADFLKTNSTSGGHSIWTFYGVFNENFIFRKVLNGEYEDGSSYNYFDSSVKYFDTTTYKTDRFLTDFFQFVPYTYVNDALMKKIGWKTIAFLDAANKFANSLEGTALLYTKLGSTVLNTDLVEALKTNTWSQYANPDILIQLVDILFDGQNSSVLINYLQYIFSSTNDYSFIFDNELRSQIVEYIYEKYESSINTSELLNFANGYSTILANALCSDTDNAVKQDLIGHISDYVRELSTVTQKELLLAFIDYLRINGDTYFAKTTKTSKYDLLLNLFNNIDADNDINAEAFYSTLLSLFSDANKIIINGATASLAGYGAFKKKSAPDKVLFFESVISNNTYANISNYLDDFANEISLFDYLRSDGYDEQSFSVLQSNIAYTSTTNSNLDVTEARVKLWNKIKDTNTFRNWFTNLNFGTKYYLATEVNNTYQTDSAPVPFEITGQNAINMVNSDNPNVLGTSSDLNFIYTTEVTPNTYFYGPYATDTGAFNYIPTGDGTNATSGTSISTDSILTNRNEISSNWRTTDVHNTTYTNNWYSVLFLENNNYSTVGTVNVDNYSGHQIYIRNGNTYTQTNTIPVGSTCYYRTGGGGWGGNYTYRECTPALNGSYYVNRDGSYIQEITYSPTKTYYAPNYTQLDNIKSVATNLTGGLTRATNPLIIRKRMSGNYDNSSNANLGVQLIYKTKKTDDYILINGTTKQYIGEVLLKRDSTDTTSKNYVLGNTPINCGSNDTYRVYNSNDVELTSSAQTDWSYLLDNYVYTAHVHTANSSWHTTGRTGVYIKFVQATSGGAPYQVRIEYNTSKIFTTRYIDYSASQLLSLDGYLTNYGDGTTVSTDEKDIINKVFNEILLTSGTRRTQFLQVVAKALLETLGTTNTPNHINFIDNFVANGVLTSTKVDNTTAPFDYLYYEYTSNADNTTINEYLSSLSTDDDNKKKILNAAANNKDVFAELIEILFDESRTIGADTSWDPDSGYGSSLDMEALYNKVGSTGVEAGYAFPIISTSSATVNPTNASISIPNYEGNPKTITTAYTQNAAQNNIGYFVGASTQMYRTTKTDNISFDSFYYPQNANYDYTLPFTDGNGNLHKAPSQDVIDFLKDKYSTYIYGAQINTTPDLNNVIAVENGVIDNKSGITIMPTGCIWIAPIQPGTIKFIAYNTSGTKSFRFMRITRDTATNFATGFSDKNPTTLLDADGSGGLKANRLYYYEYKVTQEMIDAGYEFVLSKGNGNESAYFCYIDFGVSAPSQDLTPSKTYYVQNAIDDYDDDFLNQIISYLSPLDAGSQQIYSKATSYEATTTYYSKIAGSYVVASGVDSSNYSNYYVVEKSISDYQNLAFCPRFMKLLAASSNEATYTLIHSLNNRDAFEDIIKYLVSKDYRNFDAIIKYANTNNLFPQDFDKYLTGGWLATDYYRKYKTDISLTILKNRITSYLASYQYITGKQSIDTDQFISFCGYINYDLEMNYGIFALASNEGIKNGVFIPDNLELDTMDPEYKTDTNVKFVLTDTTEERVTDASWRGGTILDDTTYEDYTDPVATYASNGVSVNEAFYIEMKQLNKSISTTVFELTLTKKEDTTNNDVTYFGDIDLDKHVITYYVPTITAGTYTVSSIDLAYRATAYEGTPTTASGTTFGVNSTVTIDNTGASNKQFTVFAEDTNVKSVYTIIFKTLTPALVMEYDTTKTTEATATNLSIESSENDKEVVLNLKAPSHLPKGFDLKPYLSLVLMDGETTETNTVYGMNSEYVILSTISTDHKVKTDGSAVITMTISYRIPDGTYHIKLSICGISTFVTFTKTASALKVLTIRYNNANVPFDANNKATSSIPFGRAYNNIELTDIAETYSSYYHFYLDSYTVSANARVSATATKSTTPKTYSFDDNTSVTYNITSYVVTYLVTAEDGTTATYKHTLTELDPYVNGADYGDLYGDGDTIQTVNTTFSTTDPTNQTKISFERGFGKYYRIKYNFTNIYTFSDNIVYSCEETTASDLAGIATLNLEYRGISADVNDDCDAGIYSFIYKYKNTQEWNITVTGTAETGYTFTVGETTYIEYTFPRLVIEKTYSTDATLHSIVLIDQYKEQSEQSTVMNIESLRPVKSSSTVTYDANESYYRNLFTEANANIKVSTPINYQLHTTDYSAVSYKDYFVVGTVSNAQLANYAPTFSTESHALIFQSITLRKMTGYGRGSQGNDSDYSVLTDHTSTSGSQLFVYLPFTYTNNGATANKIFLGKVEGKTITGIYNDQYNGTGESVTTLNKTLDDLRKYKLDDTNITITDGGVTYTLSKVVGDRTNNPSLYMDYIGNPKDDHFWFVSYVVFSEDYIRSATSTDYIKFYHVALIDISNNVYFTIKVVAPKDEIFTAINQIYVTVLGNVPPANSSTTAFTQKLVGTYVTKTIVDDTENTITYELVYSITIMPSAYYYFYIDLPGGYVATTEITNPAKVFKAGVSSDYLGHIANYPGAYLPPSSLVVQRVPLTITVTRGDSSDSAWAIATSDIYTRLATLVVNDEQSNQ